MISNAFLSPGASQHQKLILVLLNYTLPKSTPVFWNRAALRICADGGANRLYDAAPGWHSAEEPGAARRRYVPDVIKGDLDSVRQETADFYAQLGTRIVDLSEDQDSTDLMKCLKCALKHIQDEPACFGRATILALGAMGGRLDHGISNINTLYANPGVPIVLCGEGGLARLVPAGRHTIQPIKGLEGPTCALISLGAPAIVSSKGLQWDMDGLCLSVSGQQSTSNRIVADEVEVESDQPLLWTTTFQDGSLT